MKIFSSSSSSLSLINTNDKCDLILYISVKLVSFLFHRMEKIKSKQENAPYQQVTPSTAHAEASYCPKRNGSPL